MRRPGSAEARHSPLNSEANYTRSYYLNGSDYIISGSCEVFFVSS